MIELNLKVCGNSEAVILIYWYKYNKCHRHRQRPLHREDGTAYTGIEQLHYVNVVRWWYIDGAYYGYSHLKA